MSSHRITSVAVLAVTLASLGASIAQTLPQLDNGYRNRFSLEGPPPVPDLAIDPRVPTSGQWVSGTAFSGWLTTRIKNAGGTVVAGDSSEVEGPATLVIPKYEHLRHNGTINLSRSYSMQAMKLGRPLSLRISTLAMGSEIPRPDRDLAGQPVDLDYYLAEPANSGTGRFYWSRHAQKVFATEPGVITVDWEERVSGTINTQTYVVSGSPALPAKRIYWTEKGFTGPLVQVPEDRVSDVNVVYNSNFPESVADGQDYRTLNDPPVDPSVAGPAERRTLWFDELDNSIHAYNVEGRIFVEYLGDVRVAGLPGDASTEEREHLGFEIVDVIKEVRPAELKVPIGDPVLPSDGNPDLRASVIAGLTGETKPYLYEHVSLGGTRRTLYAIRETTPIVISDRNEDGVIDQLDEQQSNEVLIHWLERGVMGLYWPKEYVGYVFKWPEEFDFIGTAPTEADLAAYYSLYARPEDPEDAEATGVQLTSADNPYIQYQDDETQQHAQLTPQAIFYTQVDTSTTTGRTLIRYTSGENIWFERVYSKRNSDFEGYNNAPTSVDVGDRILSPANSDSAIGYIRQTMGTAFNPNAYLDPFVEGFEAAAAGAIIGVNALPGNDELEVWWYTYNQPGSDAFSSTPWPSAVKRYKLTWPTGGSEIVLARNDGSGDLGIAASGRIYRQPDPNLPGYNPNEEHALMSGGVAWALRDDLNLASSSAPYVLVEYTAEDGRPAMVAHHVLRENAQYTFRYAATVGAILQAPMPLPFLAPPVDESGILANYENQDTTPDSPAAGGNVDGYYERFTWNDRKGSTWVYRGVHDLADEGQAGKEFSMHYYYKTQAEFDFPDLTPPAVGSIVPYLRPYSNGTDASGGFSGDPIGGTPAKITFVPTWPSTPAVLNIGETLTLPKRGLPAVRGQTSVRVLYQQSLANAPGGDVDSVKLHDPTRAKTYALAPGALEAIPGSVATSDYLGKLFFPALPPHLSERVFLDPNIGEIGSLVFVGEFKDELFGEKYLLLNVLSNEDITALKDLCDPGDSAKTAWDAAIDGLETVVETFKEDPAKRGTFIVDSAKTLIAGPGDLAEISGGNTAVDSHALTATGGGTGFVVLATGNGKAFTPDAEPVSLHVIKVDPPLYRGELKVIASANPLDEKLTLQHTGDFAGRPEEYEFAWLSAPPVNGLAPIVYTFSHLPVVGDGSWQLLPNPQSGYEGFRDFLADDSGPGWQTTGNLAFNQITINDGNGTAENGVTLPHALLRRTFTHTGASPIGLYLSLDLDDNDGAVIYLNNAELAAWNVPGREDSVATTAPALPGFNPLERVFSVDPVSLLSGDNTLTVELYTASDAGAQSDFNLRLEGTTETEDLSQWSNEISAGAKSGQGETGKARHTIEGASILTLTDNYLTMRYRALPGTEAATATNGEWSRWMNPQLAEGWIKRALAGINPFQQRVTDLLNNAVNTDVSLLTQAGKRWEGDIALNLENIDDFGLIEIYETILNRGKGLSISGNPPLNVPSANDALLLAAGYLNDLYLIHGNEAFADAANPTIAFDTADGEFGDFSTALFAFKGQVSTVLEEELALLRGRDDFLAPGNTVAPVYNRLPWNFTRGINSGEAIYALNYNIRDLDASGAADAADAAVSFPQGHGDAYGHYLTALKVYYTLLSNPHFAWTPRIEAVLVLGQPVSVDYLDERKFASAAAALARTASQTLDLTYRQEFTADPNAGWGHLRDGRTNTQTGITRRWGTDEWAARSGQGTYFHWITANSILPETDPNPANEGIQKVDRTTVPELDEVVAHAIQIQQTADNSDARLNPLGLARGAVAFDISPAELDEGRTHFEQVYDRAVAALENAVFAFDNAKDSTRFLRQQENSLVDQLAAIQEQEVAFENELIEIYGTPYPDDIGPGKTYTQGYEGPDLVHPLYVEVSELLFDPSSEQTFEIVVPLSIGDITITEEGHTFDILNGDVVTYHLNAEGALVKPAEWSGRRLSPGRIQAAASNLLSARHRLLQAVDDFNSEVYLLDELVGTFEAISAANSDSVARIGQFEDEAADLEASILTLRTVARETRIAGELAWNAGLVAAEYFPKTVGLSNDATSAGRGTALLVGLGIGEGLLISAEVSDGVADGQEFEIEQLARGLERLLAANELDVELAQMLQDLRTTLSDLQGMRYAIDQALRDIDQAARDLQTAQIDGITVQRLRETFRKRTAGVIQGYRTRDLAFRVFRDESLEKYKTLFDLASRYTYLAARAYDYETGLLDLDGSNAAARFFDGIVQSRALGVVEDGQPQFTSSETGDPGLAGVLAQMSGDWSVVRSRLGFNNEDRDRTLFSLREENFRIIPSEAGDTAWRETLDAARMDNLLDDPDVRRFAMQIDDGSGLAVPGLVLEFQTSIQEGLNFFGKPLAGGDHTFSPTTFATKIRAAGIAFDGYIGMDSPTVVGGVIEDIGGGSPPDPNQGFLDPDALSATPYIYLIPAGVDLMRSPPLGDRSGVRTWTVEDQAIPLPFNIGQSDFSTRPAWVSAESLAEPAFVLRKHQAFRAVPGDTVFGSQFGTDNAFTSARLIGRSAWNSSWKIIIPGRTLLQDAERGIDAFTEQVRDIFLYLDTYSYSGN